MNPTRKLASARIHLIAEMICALAATTAGAGQVAYRAREAIKVDGRLDEPAWSKATVFREFVESFPDEGGSPHQRTAVRVVYDDRTLYVGVKCYDDEPGSIVRPLARRDNGLEGDLVQVYVDANATRRTAALFVLTAAGVQGDAWVFDDDQIAYDWDAVWDGATVLLDDGWSAEFAIPLSVFSYGESASRVWGFGVQRIVGRTHARSASTTLPRGARGLASRLQPLTGIDDVHSYSDMSIAPQVVSRLRVRPQYSDPARPQPRIAEPSADIGADFSMRLGSALRLFATLNPDFGQVESDEVILNTSNFEILYPEKRPFFYEGMDLFKPVGSGEAQQPHQLFYSRRIGLSEPIWGAGKLVGQVGDNVEIGFFDAVVSGTGQLAPSSEDTPDRSLRWTPSQPLRFAPGMAYPPDVPPRQNLFAGVVRVKATEALRLSLQITSASPLAGSCTAVDLEKARLPASCRALGGNAGALSFETASPGGDWYAYGQTSGTQMIGGPPYRILPDGTRLERGDLGLGAYVRAGKRGGEPWRFDLHWTYATPKLEMNALGYQPAQNVQEAGAAVSFARPTGNALFHEYSVTATTWSQWTTDARGLGSDQGASIAFDGLLRRAYLALNAELLAANPRYDAREVRVANGAEQGAGIAMEIPGLAQARCTLSTDRAAALSFSVTPTVGRTFAEAPLSDQMSYSVGSGLQWRPAPRLETKLDATAGITAYSIRYADGDGQSRPLLFARQRVASLSIVLRQMLTVTSRLTVQAYVQFFSAWGQYGPFFRVPTMSHDRILLADLVPAEPSADPAFVWFREPGFHEAMLVINANLRWEYAPGSFIWLVYRRDQAEPPTATDASASRSFAPRALSRGPTVDTGLLKWVHFVRLAN